MQYEHVHAPLFLYMNTLIPIYEHVHALYSFLSFVNTGTTPTSIKTQQLPPEQTQPQPTLTSCTPNALLLLRHIRLVVHCHAQRAMLSCMVVVLLLLLLAFVTSLPMQRGPPL